MNKLGKQTKKIEGIKKKILPVLKENRVKKAGIFGSYARGEQGKNSDIDILVEVQNDWSLLDLIKLQKEIEKVIQNRIDLLEYNELHPLLRKEILMEEIKIL